MQLNQGNTVMCLDAVRQAGEAGNVFVIPDTQLARETLADSLYVPCARHGESKATLGAHGQPCVLIIRQGAINITLAVGEGGKHETVFHGGTARKGER